MASKPSRTAAKRYHTMARLAVKDLVGVFVAGKNESVKVWNTKKKRQEVISQTLANALIDVPYKWLQHCVITGKRQDGQLYSKLEVLEAPHPVKQSQISLACNEQHQNMLKEFNHMHLLTVAWIASPNGVELDNDELNEILTHFGAYDFLAEWEQVK